MLRNLKSLLLPLGLLGLAMLVRPVSIDLQGRELIIMGGLPLVLAAVTLGLCYRFNRSRIFFATISLLVAYVIVHWYVGTADPVYADILWASASLLLPIILVTMSLMEERGMFTLWGLGRFAVIILPFALVLGIANIHDRWLQQLLASRIFEQNLINGLNLYQIPMLLALLAVLILYGMFFIRNASQNATLLGALLAAVAMFHFWNEPSTNAMFAASAMLMMAINVVHESWNMAYIDPLTGLPGRRALEEEMLKLGGNYSIAMIDIDHFKKFNDRHGHDAGDQVLSMVASRIKSVQSGGKAFRYGGEEFTVIFTGKKTGDIVEALDDMREEIGSSQFRLRSMDRRVARNGKNTGGKTVNVTISAGMAERNDRYASPQQVLKQADKALYRAKKKGRNIVSK